MFQILVGIQILAILFIVFAIIGMFRVGASYTQKLMLAFLAAAAAPLLQVGVQYLLLKFTAMWCGLLGTKEHSRVTEIFAQAPRGRKSAPRFAKPTAAAILRSVKRRHKKSSAARCL